MTTIDEDRAEGATLRERKKAQTRRAIHEAAIGLVDDQGLDGTTIEQICQAADVSPRTFFNYYPSKPAAVLGLPEQPLAPDAIDRFRESPLPLVPALCELFGGMASIGAEERLRVKSIVARRPELQPTFAQWIGAMQSKFLDIAEHKAGDRETAQLAITLVMAAVATVAREEGHENVPDQERLREIIHRIGELARA